MNIVITSFNSEDDITSTKQDNDEIEEEGELDDEDLNIFEEAIQEEESVKQTPFYLVGDAEEEDEIL